MSVGAKLFLSSILAALVAAGIFIAYLGVSSESIEAELYALAEFGVDANVEDWQALSQRSQRLSQLAGFDGASQDLNARVWFFGAEYLPMTPKMQIEALRKAREGFLKAIKLRPRWPYTWLNLARVEFALDARGNWEDVLATALRLNLRGTFLQMDLMRFRKKLGLRLNGELARAVEVSLDQGFADDPDAMVREAIRIGRREWACATPVNSQVQKFCEVF